MFFFPERHGGKMHLHAHSFDIGTHRKSPIAYETLIQPSARSLALGQLVRCRGLDVDPKKLRFAFVSMCSARAANFLLQFANFCLVFHSDHIVAKHTKVIREWKAGRSRCARERLCSLVLGVETSYDSNQRKQQSFFFENVPEL